MKLPFFSQKKQENEIYLGIFLKQSKGTVLIFEKSSHQLIITEKVNFSYTNGWENLVEDIDEALFQLEKKLTDKNIEFKKTIFFVYSHLIDEKTGEIKKPYLEKIKQLVKELDLEAMGYIEVFEAVNYFFQKKEETSLTSILLELDDNQLTFFVYKSGKLEYKKTVARTDDVIEDFIEASSDIKGKMIFPSRIIIYDSDNLDDTIALFIAHRWEKEYFIQMPKMTVLKEDELIEGLRMLFDSQINKTKAAEIVDETNVDKNKKEETFGFVIGEDIEERLIEEKKPEKKSQWPKISFVFPKISPPDYFKDLSLIKGKLTVILGLLIIFLSLFINEYFYHKAELTIFLPNKIIEKTLLESIDYKTASTTANFSQTITTSGKKDVGEKAKGVVTIHNFDDQEKTFSKGTVLTASNLKFVLDTDVKVASATLTADGSAKLPGKKDATITAQEIGPESNLSKGTKFKIADLSINTYFAINANDLTGGTKKQIRTVSSTDIATLEDKILEKAKTENKQNLFSSSDVLIPELSQVDFIEKKYSAELGEEADSVSLNAKVNLTYFAYNKNNLLDTLQNNLKDGLDQEFSLEKNNINYKIKDIKKENHQLKLTIEAKGKAIKKIDQNKLISEVLGKSQKNLE
ncbi:MAG: hypothetical protein ACPLRN_03090, partial [Microgenomates group bacterium]